MTKKKASRGKEASKQQAKELKKKKQGEKASKAAKKRSDKDARDAGEDDIEAILADILRKDQEKTTVSVSICDGPPSPRAGFTVTSLPSGDMVLFGGEFFDGQDTTCFNDLYRWSVEKNEWRQIESPNTPPPRCSHQAAFYRDHLYIFGGEFATTEQFYHYRDFWRLDVKTNSWEKLDVTGKPPSARSGHRMVVWRNQLVLFGGFYEAFRETKWFNDLYILTFQDLRWRRVDFSVVATVPTPRSGHQMACHAGGDQIFLCGGWSKVKEAGKKSEGKTHNDMWVLNMKQVVSGGNPTWNRIGKKGTPPSIRSGAAMTVHKNRALLFGGVLDHEGPQHAMRSIFYNDLFAFDMDRRRWYHLALKKASKGKNKGKGKRKDDPTTTQEIVNDDNDDGGEEEEDYIDSDDEEAEVGVINHDNTFVYIDEIGKLVYVEHEQEVRDGEGVDAGDGESNLEEKCDEDQSDNEAPEPSIEVEDSDRAGAVLRPPRDSKGQAADKTNTSLVETPDVPLQNLSPSPLAARDRSSSPGTGCTKSVQQEGRTRGGGGDGNVKGEDADNQKSEDVVPPLPLPRINPCLTVRGNTLYVYGGLLEVGDREYALDDCWSLELNTRLAWTRVQEGTMEEQIWKGEEDESELGSEIGVDIDSDDDDDDDEEEVDDGKDEETGEDAVVGEEGTVAEMLHDGVDVAGRPRKGKGTKEKSKRGYGGLREEIRQLKEHLGVDDPDRTPQTGEAVRDFFDRTKMYWLKEIVHRREAATGNLEPATEKELRRDAFALAEERYAELEPTLLRLNEVELEQKELEERDAEKRRVQKSSGARGSSRR